MNKMKLLTFGFVCLLVLNLVLLGMMMLHRPPDPSQNHPNPEEGPKKHIIQKLHFDADQSKQYQVLIDQHQAKLRDIESSIKTAKYELYVTLSDPTSPQKDSLLAQLSGLLSTIEALHYEHFKSIRLLCREEQIPAFDQLSTELANLFQLKKNRGRPGH